MALVFHEVNNENFAVFHDLMNDYYRDGEDADTPQEDIDEFISMLFNMVCAGSISGRLAKLDKDNVLEVLSMRAAPEQRLLVSENYYSIAQAYVDKSIKPFAVMDGGMVVGFLAVVLDKKEEEYWILRLLIDERFQKKGYGRAACTMGVEWLKKQGAPWVKISFDEENTNAERLYRSIGFKPTGQIEDDEIIYKIEF